MKFKGATGAVVVVAIVSLDGGCGSSSSSGDGPAKSSAPSAINVKGTITLTGDDDAISWDGGDGTPPDGAEVDDGYTCEGTGGYDDITAGSQVVISSDTGKTLAIGSLADEDGVLTGNTYSATCVMDWTVKGVPTSEKFYNIKIGHRDGPKWTLKQLKAGPQLSLGGS